MLTIRPLASREELAELISKQPLNPFLESWAWGDFQQATGRRIWRLGAWAGQKLVSAALVIEHELLLGKKYLYCPRGPLAESLPALLEMFSALRALGKTEGAMYVKVDPGLYHFPFRAEQFPEHFDIGTTLQPKHTLVIDTARDPGLILEQLHQKTRYNIRLAEKKGVEVRWSTTDADLAIFLELLQATAERQGIRLHPNRYYQKMFEVLRPAGMAELALGQYEDQVHAANLVIWHGQTATYLHGGSRDDRKEAMVPQLVQWRTIERAHHLGIKDYDLWGVAPADQPDHAWAGISRFKRGFNGREISFPPAANSILQSQWYTAYRLAKRVRGGRDE